MTIRVLFPIYVGGVMCFIGWFMVIFFLPTGMWAFVFENIGEFVTRPKKMTDDEFNRTKADLQKKVSNLLSMGKKLASERKEWQLRTRKFWWWNKIRD